MTRYYSTRKANCPRAAFLPDMQLAPMAEIETFASPDGSILDVRQAFGDASPSNNGRMWFDRWGRWYSERQPLPSLRSVPAGAKASLRRAHFYRADKDRLSRVARFPETISLARHLLEGSVALPRVHAR